MGNQVSYVPLPSTGKLLFQIVLIVALVFLGTARDAGAVVVSGGALLSANGSDRAAGYAETNKIISWGDKVHVAWQDYSSAVGFLTRIRTYDRSTQTWSPTYTVGSAQDNHGGPALTVDSQGYLHIVYYPHHGELRYRKSTMPNDAWQWEDEVLFGDDCTYPTLMVGPDDTLYCTARSSMLDPWSVNLYSKPTGGDWSEPTVIMRAEYLNYSHFQEALAWSPDHQTLHLSTRIYSEKTSQIPGWSQAIGYMKSEDFGQTWTHYDGTPISGPATKSTIDTIEVIDPSMKLLYTSGVSLRSGGLAVDPNGIPHVLYSALDDGGTLPHQAWMATPDESGGWDKVLLNDKCDVLPVGWGLSTPGGITIGDDGTIFLTLEMCDPNASDVSEPWTGNSTEIVWMESRDGGQTFESTIISNVDPNTPHWMPSIERETGFNDFDVPSMMYMTDAVNGSSDVIWHEFYSAPRIPGDANRDGSVDSQDAVLLAANWNSETNGPWLEGDLDGNAFVNAADASIMAANWGNHNESSSATAVPEPGSLALLILGALMLASARRRQFAAGSRL